MSSALLLFPVACGEEAASDNDEKGDSEGSQDGTERDASGPDPLGLDGGMPAAVDGSVPPTTPDAGRSPDASRSDATVDDSPEPVAQSDDFSAGKLNENLWEIVDPVGDGEVSLIGTGTADAQLRLHIPGETAHDPWVDGNNALRVMQPVTDEDFGIEVKFESTPTERFQIQGVIVEANETDYIRLDVHSNDDVLNVYVATFVDDAPKIRVDMMIPDAANIYLRLARQADEWDAHFSTNGKDWQLATTFSFPLRVDAAGVFVGNADPNPAEFTALVDYFFDVAAPIQAEDDAR